MGCSACRKKDDEHADLALDISSDNLSEEGVSAALSAYQSRVDSLAGKFEWKKTMIATTIQILVDSPTPIYELSDLELVTHLNNVMSAAGVLEFLQVSQSQFLEVLKQIQQRHTNLPYNNFALTVSVATQLYKLVTIGRTLIAKYLPPDDFAMLFIAVLALNFNHRRL